MKRYLLYSSLVVFIISCSFSENLTSDVNLYESKTNYTPKKYDKILICGSGAKQVRLFLENLSGKLFKAFEKDGVQTKYIYLGNGPENSDSALRN